MSTAVPSSAPTANATWAPSSAPTVALPTEVVLGPWDIAVVVLYLVGVLVVAIVASRLQIVRERGGHGAEGYFLGARHMPGWSIMLALFSSNVGARHYVGLAGIAAASGLCAGGFELGAVPCVLVLAYVALPTYMRAGVATTPEYLERRFGRVCRIVVVAVSLALYVFSKISATLYAWDVVVKHVLHINEWLAASMLLLVTVLYTLLGGMTALIYTEALQTVVLICGGGVVLYYARLEGGGWAGLEGALDPSYLHLVQPAGEEDGYPWTGFVFGLPSVVFWHWCVDQVVVQRPLSARNVAHGQAGCVGAAALKLLPLFLMVLPGVYARKIIQERVLHTNTTDFNFDQAYPWLVVNVVPVNLRGLILSAMLSALMSSLASVFHSSAALFTLDVWRIVHPRSSQRTLVVVGRVTVAALTLLSLAWLPLIPHMAKSFFAAIQEPPAYLAPPISVLYAFGMVSSYPTRLAGGLTLAVGITLGVARLSLSLAEAYDSSFDFGLFTGVHFLHFAAINTLVSTAVLFFASSVQRLVSKHHAVAYEATASGDDLPVDLRVLFSHRLFGELMQHDELRAGQLEKLDLLVELTGLDGATAADDGDGDLAELALADEASERRAAAAADAADAADRHPSDYEPQPSYRLLQGSLLGSGAVVLVVWATILGVYG